MICLVTSYSPSSETRHVINTGLYPANCHWRTREFSLYLSLSLSPFSIIRFFMDNSITSIDKEQVLSQRCTSNLVKYSHQAFLFSSVQLKMNFGQIIPLLSYIDSYPVFPFSYILYLELRASNWKRSIGSSYADYF